MIKDIKPLVQIVDYSLYIYYGLIFLGVLLVGLGIYLFVRLKQTNKQKEILYKLKSIDFKDAKKDAYTITALSKELVVDEQLEQKSQELNFLLQKYKYKKDVPPFDDETMKKFELFLELASVRI